jgi:NitT/TauT family transport system substrate-binding protein
MPTKKWPLTVAGLVSLAAAAACSGGQADGSATAEPNGDEPTQITVGVQPFAELAPFYIAEERGLFEERGLKVDVHQANEGASLVAAMVAGEVPIIYSNYVSLFTAADKGLPARIFRENDRPGVQALYVLPDSEIQEPADFEGATIAVNGLGNVMEITARAVLEHHGVDLSTVNFVELPPPNMEAALAEGQVDAAWLVEPFVTFATNNLQARPVVSAFEGPTDDVPVAGWATTAQFLEENRQALADFKAAMDEAMKIAASDTDAVAEIIPTYTQMPPEVARSLSEISYAVDSDLSGLETWQDLLLHYEVIDKSVDLDQVVVDDSELGQS